jgi:hypothetical protein
MRVGLVKNLQEKKQKRRHPEGSVLYCLILSS